MLLFAIYLCAFLSAGTSINIEKKTIQFSSEVTTMVRAVFQKCAEENGVSPNTLDMIKQGYYNEDYTFKKYIYCVHQKTGYADPSGHIIIPKVLELFPKDINMLTVFLICNNIQGKDPIETTFLYFKCYQDTTPVRFAL